MSDRSLNFPSVFLVRLITFIPLTCPIFTALQTFSEFPEVDNAIKVEH